MSAINELIARGSQIDLPGAYTAAANLRTNDKRNALLDLQTMEFKANAPQRKLKGAVELNNLEKDATLVLSHQLGEVVRSGGDPVEWANGMADRYEGTGSQISGLLRQVSGLFQNGQGDIALANADNFIKQNTPPEKGQVLAKDAILVGSNNETLANNIQPQEQARILTPEEAAAKGLRAGGTYQIKPDGTTSVVQAPEGGADGPKVPRPLTSEMAAALGIPEEDRSKYQIGSTGEAELLPVPESSGGVKTKPFADMPFEGRTKLGLVTNADKMATLAKPAMFDENGKFKNWKSIAPTSEARNARKQLKEALMNMLRVESGAAIRPEEIEEQAELMMPGWSDHDSTAKLKWSILEQKISSMHTAMTSGYTGLPESMQLGAQGLSGQTNSGNLNFDANGNLIP